MKPDHRYKAVVDTSVVRHFLSYKGDPAGVAEFREDIEAFSRILDLPGTRFFYTPLLAHHISEKFGSRWIDFATRRRLTEISAHLPHARGGLRVGALKKIFLEPDHEAKLAKKAEEDKERVFADDEEYKKSSRYGKQRSKEHDWDHLEAALAIGADLFITTDYKLLRRLKSLTAKQKKNEAVARAVKIAARPVEALARMERRRG